MNAQATRIQPPAPANSRGELIGCLMIAATFAASLALFHRITWAIFS